MKRPFLFIILVPVVLKSYPPYFNLCDACSRHHFSSGPSAWNKDDYVRHFEARLLTGISLVAVSHYTGRNESDVNYLEPMIKI